MADMTQDRNALSYMYDQYRAIHADPDRYRGKLQQYFVDEIADLVKRHKARTLLDYGCGKGHQYTFHKQHKAWGNIMPHLYDPGYLPHASRPHGNFDGVICTDVMEHVPHIHVPWVMRDALCYVAKFAFFCIFTEPSKATLPDGRNAHLTVKPVGYWMDRVEEAMIDLYPDPELKPVRSEKNHHSVVSNGVMEVAVVFRTKATKHIV